MEDIVEKTNGSCECPLAALFRTPDRKVVHHVASSLGDSSYCAYQCDDVLVVLEENSMSVPFSHCCYSPDRSLWMVFQLAGNGTAEVKGWHHAMSPGTMIGSMGPYLERTVSNLPGQKLRRVTVRLGESFLHRHLEDAGESMPKRFVRALEDDGSGGFYFGADIDPGVGVSLQQLSQNPYDGALGLMFAESRSLEVACYMLDFIRRDQDNRRMASLSSQDTERLQYARDILLADLGAIPPSIAELARKIGMSEKKLKTGFRTLFGDTIYACHRNARMDYARRLMVEGRLNVCDIACTVGYSNPSHFTRAFHARFGVNPGTYLRDIRSKGYHVRAVMPV